jgi:acetyl-CoA acetyltransferase
MSRIRLFPETAKTLPLALARARSFAGRLAALASFRPRHLKPVVALEVGLTDYVRAQHGETAEVLAREPGITREAQIASRFRATARQRRLSRGAMGEGGRAADVSPKHDRDRPRQRPRENQSIEALAKLRPYSTAAMAASRSATPSDHRRRGGRRRRPTPTPASTGFRSSVECAAGVLRAVAVPHGARPGSVAARALADAGVSVRDVGLWEINEASRAARLPAAFGLTALRARRARHRRALGAIDPERLNVNGGDCPRSSVGATGAGSR